MGGAMDLVTGAKRVIISMEHCDKHGNSKILKECNLPLTAANCVDLIVTDMAVIRVTEKGLLLEEIAFWTNKEDVIKSTAAELIIPQQIKVFGK